MQCDICKRPSSSRLPFNCVDCARNALYEPRVQLAQILLQNEAISKDVERNIGAKSTSNNSRTVANIKSPELRGAWTLEQAKGDQICSTAKTQAMLSHVEALRKETESMKIEVAKRKSSLLKRRSVLKSAVNALSQHELVALKPVEKGVRRIQHRWDAIHTKTAESRVFLCREAAQLYGLQQRKRRKGALGRDVYLIGGIPIVDLRDLNNASSAQVTTSITNLAHLIHLVSHYLSIRLPAEITLSHRDYPLPTIFSPASSYTPREVPFPGSSNNSPSASRTADQRSLPRPRPLHLDKKLSVLAKEDSVAYAFFVEGITFLAWDVAWVCKTQGLDVSAGSWEEVCAMGRNLWQLLVGPPAQNSTSPPPATRIALSIQDTPSRPTIFRNPTSMHPPHPPPSLSLKPPSSPTSLGYYSHGTAHSFLAGAEGAEYLHGWRLQSPVKVIEKVKAMLLSERTGAEWEILEGNEWLDEEGGEGERTGDSSAARKGGDEGKARDMTAGGEVEEGKSKGTSGWMKVKSRAGV